jgi:hypothetical protein
LQKGPFLIIYSPKSPGRRTVGSACRAAATGKPNPSSITRERSISTQLRGQADPIFRNNTDSINPIARKERIEIRSDPERIYRWNREASSGNRLQQAGTEKDLPKPKLGKQLARTRQVGQKSNLGGWS